MARGANLTGFHVWAQESIDRNMRSGLFDVPVLLGALSRKAGAAGMLGRPGVSATVGRNVGVGDEDGLAGSTLHHVQFNTAKVGGGTTLGQDGTTSSAGDERSDKKWQSCYVHWFYREFPIAIRNHALRQARGKFALGNVVSKATALATEELIEDLATRVYTGNPSSQSTDEPWDNLLGLDQWIDDDNTIGGVDRTSVTGFNGVDITAATTLSLSLLDTAMFDYDGSGNGLLSKGSRADLWIMGSVNYNKLKQEALARGGQLITNSMPNGGEVGFLNEFINYNGKMIVADSHCATASVYGLDTRTWTLQVDPAENFRVLPFVNLREDQPGTGQPDLTTSAIAFGGRLICEEPWKNIKYTNAT